MSTARALRLRMASAVVIAIVAAPLMAFGPFEGSFRLERVK